MILQRFKRYHLFLGAKMRVLRDKSLSTRLLILSEITSGRYSHLSPIAQKLGITIQAVSDYLKKLREDGFVQHINGEYKATMDGVEFLHHEFLELKKFIDLKMDELSIIENCVAIAKTEIKKGEKAGLYMEDGILVAYAGKKSSSMGIAMRDALKGEDVPLKNLEGVMEHEIGKIYFIEVPSSLEGGSRTAKKQGIQKLLEEIRPNRIGVMGVVAKSIMEKIGKKYDFEFALAESAIEMAQCGLTVALIGSSEKIREGILKIENFNSSSLDKIRYNVINP
mgnify:CR=1 FL=1